MAGRAVTHPHTAAKSLGRLWTAAAVVLIAFPGLALSQEVTGPCTQVVGTYLTTNELTAKGGKASSRSLLVLTNGGHVLRFDSDEQRAATDRRAFGDSAGAWRCDGADADGTVRLTAAMLDFTYPGSAGKSAQIVRLDVAGRYLPSTETLELTGEVRFLAKTADAQDPAAASKDISPSFAIVLRGQKIELPAPRRER